MLSARFPDNFIWGVATSAFQIEGATREDGRGESIWDRFCRTPGKIEDGTNGDVACDHYRLWQRDIALMKELGVKAYRFSVAWPRILPNGRGTVNRAGLDFYSRLIDGLLGAGIIPYVTLYHWDLPQTLQDEGGWAVRTTAEAFAEYADALGKRLGDRVKNWITHNEPWCASHVGHAIGRHAPGIQNWPVALAASHHLLLSHGLAVPILRSHSKGAEVGITLNLNPGCPASPSAADADAYRHFDGGLNRWFLDPLYGRGYPGDMVEDYVAAGKLSPEGFTVVKPGDVKTIAAHTDFLGINYYMRSVIRSDKIPETENAPRTVFQAPESEWTEMKWEVYSEGLFQILNRVSLTYGPTKIYVTENGASYSDGPGPDGRVKDERRTRYLRDHFLAAHRAMEAGVPLAGYFVWSLMDNFEWGHGYTQRFGITWVDYETQTRTLKDSALWCKKVFGTHTVE